jgi:hypothetical protein
MIAARAMPLCAGFAGQIVRYVVECYKNGHIVYHLSTNWLRWSQPLLQSLPHSQCTFAAIPPIPDLPAASSSPLASVATLLLLFAENVPIVQPQTSRHPFRRLLIGITRRRRPERNDDTPRRHCPSSPQHSQTSACI